MKILFFPKRIRMNRNWIRSKQFFQELYARGHEVRFTIFLVNNEEEWQSLDENIRKDAYTIEEVMNYAPEVVIFERSTNPADNRRISREFINALKKKGCIVVHCGLDYNEYNEHRLEYDGFFADAGFKIFVGNANEPWDEIPSIRNADWGQETRISAAEIMKVSSIQSHKLIEDVDYVESSLALMIEQYEHVLLTGGSHSRLKGDTGWKALAQDLPHVYAAYTTVQGVEVLITGHFVTDREERNEGYGNRKYLINLLEYLNSQKTEQLNKFFLTRQKENRKMKILFVAADPTNATRLRLNTEFREIKSELVERAIKRADFELALPALSVRIADFSKALLDEKPRIVHFSGHGAESGELCFENESGEIEIVNPGGLAALFRLSAKHVECVVLNACYSELQAREIVKHIDFVVGMSKSIPDPVAIAFSIGFYQALGSGEDIPTSYEYGCAQIQMRYKTEHAIPVLLTKS